MEPRSGTVHRQQPGFVFHLRRCDRARAAPNTKLFNVNPKFQTIVFTDNSATSDYHAMQLKFQRRLSRSLQVLASYNLSHSIDIASTDAGNNRTTPGTLTSPNSDRGNSDFDIRHSFTTGLTYDLPFRSSQKILKRLWVVGRWRALCSRDQHHRLTLSARLSRLTASDLMLVRT
jgi:hypothetical protein